MLKEVLPMGKDGTKKPDAGAAAVFRETAKGAGRLRMRPHEAYEDELEERQQKI